MSKRPRPLYTNKNSIQTLREGLQEYYAVHSGSGLTHPSTQPKDFAKILLAHDASHVIYGCDTGMYDELKILPLTFLTSDFKFRDWLRERKNPAVDVMYKELVERYGVIWLYSSILVELPRLLPELILMWLKNRHRQRFVPFIDFEPLLDHSLWQIRQDFDLFPFIK